jgi:tRNA acetyltransferase TAN1
MVLELIWNFNILATSEPWSESEACGELWMLLRKAGDNAPEVDYSIVRGLITAKTSLNPIEALKKFRFFFHENPDDVKFLLRVIPMERVVRTDLEEIVKASKILSSVIEEEDSFRITLEKRKTDLRSREVIEAVAKVINRKVNLTEPNWIIQIEIVGKVTGISVLKTDELLNIQKERFNLSSRSD